MDCSLPGSSVHQIFQATILEWVAISSSKGSFQPRDWTQVSCIGRWILYYWATWEAQVLYTVFLKWNNPEKNVIKKIMCVHVQLVPTLCNPMDCDLPGSSVHGIFQARILEWVAIFYSRAIFLSQGSKPESPALAGGFITTVPPEKKITGK